MARKTPGSSGKRSESPTTTSKQTAKTKPTTQPATAVSKQAAAKIATKQPEMKKGQPQTTAPARPVARPEVRAEAATKTAFQPPELKPKPAKSSDTLVLERAEADLTAALETLNKQMNSALTTLAELAVAHRGRGEAVIRTQPLDRATATFQRLITEVVDDKLGEMLPPLIALRGEMAHLAGAGQSANPDDGDFYQRGLAGLDHVLSMAGVHSYTARTGEPFDPLIHLAVGETCRQDLADGVVAEAFAPGFRTARGKVVAAAKVKVNRR